MSAHWRTWGAASRTPVGVDAKTPNGHGTRNEFRFPDFDLTEGGTVTFNVTIEALPDGEVDGNVAQLEEPVPGDAADRDIIQVRLVQSEGAGRVTW